MKIYLYRAVLLTLLLLKPQSGLAESTLNSIKPFNQFIGNWTLKNDDWQQNYDGENTQSIKIAHHYTSCERVNTDSSVLCVITSPSATGHILWSFNHQDEQVHHLSSFGSNRTGVGRGTISEQGDIELIVKFEGEPANSHRLYRYRWLSDDEYSLMSTQFIDGVANGQFYGGNFIRIQ